MSNPRHESNRNTTRLEVEFLRAAVYIYTGQCEGLCLADIADVAGVCRNTFRRWRKSAEESFGLKLAYKRADAKGPRCDLPSFFVESWGVINPVEAVRKFADMPPPEFGSETVRQLIAIRLKGHAEKRGNWGNQNARKVSHA